MSGRTFVDANVLVYAADTSHADKHHRSKQWLEALWRARDGCVSTQVLNEFYVTVTRKMKPGMSRAAARLEILQFNAWRPLPVDTAVMDAAWIVEEKFGLSWWDSLVVAAAQVGACPWLLTEDLQDGQDFDGVRVINPFTAEPR